MIYDILYIILYLGLVSHSHLEQMRSSVEKSLNLVHSENNEIHRQTIDNLTTNFELIYSVPSSPTPRQSMSRWGPCRSLRPL